MAKVRFRFAQPLIAFYTAVHDLADTYHPERHYMRGPGPKCREKQRALEPAVPPEPRAAPACRTA